MASCTVRFFSASSSLIFTMNSSSSDMISSTRSRESAFRSSMKFASGVTSSSLTLNCSAMIFFRRSSALAGIVFLRTPFSSSSLCCWMDGRVICARHMRRRFEIAAGLDRSSEDSVYELCRGLTAEKLAQLNRLVDRGPEWHCSIAVQGFIESDAQNVAVNRRHLRERPQRRALLNHSINCRPIVEDATYQVLRIARRVAQHFVGVGRD